MSKYTTELRNVIDSGYPLFNFPYDFYDPNKKEELEKKFVDHFYFWEIGSETPARFQHNLKVKFQEVLPYYSLILQTALYEYDIKNNYNLTETLTRDTKTDRATSGTTDSEIDQTSTATNTSTDLSTAEGTRTPNLTDTQVIDGQNINSDTPGGLLSLASIETGVYASKVDMEDRTLTGHQTGTETTAQDSESTQTGSGTNNSNQTGTTSQEMTEGVAGKETYTLERIGDIGVDSTPDKLKKHLEIQEIFAKAYMNFFAECEDLFMMIY